uniref:F-box domain-containing protein n=1 Tax=Mycena chlorophos TaxID=658473 RepID=A0ABQ0LPB5_MYCCL|nr:predicted protein [Mycena chlorophos]
MVSELPFELERRIFELAATSHLRNIPQLCQVAWRVKEWVEPLLYTTLAIYNDDDIINGLEIPGEIPSCSPGICDVAFSSRPHLRAHVRNVIIPEKIEPETVYSILRGLRNVENLFLVGIRRQTMPIHWESYRTLRHLYCHPRAQDMGWTAGATFGHPIFSNITHLEMFNGFPDDSKDSAGLRGLASLPSLSHLALDWLDIPTLKRFLEIPLSETRVRTVVVLTMSMDHTSERLEDAEDAGLGCIPRLVVTALPDYIEDWQRGVLSGDDYWARADALIAKRLSGEVDEKTLVF